MAKIPPALENPRATNPGMIKGAVPVRSPASEDEDVDFIVKELAPMSNEALDEYFNKNKISEEDRASILAAIEESKAQDGAKKQAQLEQSAQEQPVPQRGFSAYEGKELPTGPGSARMIAEGTTLKPSEILELVKQSLPTPGGIGRFSRDVSIGYAADLPPAALGMATTAGLARLGVPLPASAALGATVGGLSAISGLTEKTYNFLRQGVGLSEEEFGPVATSLAALGPIFAAKGTLEPVTKEIINKQAAQGAMRLRDAAKKLMQNTANLRTMSSEDRVAYLKSVDDTIQERATGYIRQGYTQEEAARKTLEDVPLLIKANDHVQKAMQHIPDMPFEKFRELSKTGQEPGIAGIETAIKGSKIRQNESFVNLEKEVKSGIEMAKKGKVSYETASALQIPQKEIMAELEPILTAATPSLPTTARGDKVLFLNGKFRIQKKNGVIADFEKDQYNAWFMNAAKSDDYLGTLLKAYNDITTSNFKVGTSGEVAVASLPTSQILTNITKLKQSFKDNFQKGPAVKSATSYAEQDVYKALLRIEDKALDVLSNSEIPSLSSAARAYRLSKELSELSAGSMDDLSKMINADPVTMGNAVLEQKNETIKNFVALKRGEMAATKQVIPEDLPQYMARQALQNRFSNLLALSDIVTTKTGIPTRETILKLPALVSDLKKDANLRLKMETLLGQDTFKSMLGNLESAAKEFERIGNLMLVAEKGKKDVAAMSALEQRGAAVLLSLTNKRYPGTFAAFAKSIADKFGNDAIRSKVNRVVFSQHLPVLVDSITSPKMAADMRNDIIKTFGKDDKVALSVLSRFDKEARRKLLSISNLKKSLMAATPGAVTGALSAEQPQPEERGPISLEEAMSQVPSGAMGR